MAAPEDTQHLYEQLAGQCARRKETLQRDVFLVLAADSALALGRADQAERLRRQILELNPSTMLRPFASFAEALDSSDIREYIFELRQQYPPETAAQMLEPGANGSLLPADLFDEPSESQEFFASPTSSLFGDGGPVQADPFEAARRTPPPSIHVPKPARPSAAAAPPSAAPPSTPPSGTPPPGAPAKPRRRSPYENPDYGPRVPANAKPAQDFVGVWIINVLVGLVGLLTAGILAVVFIRPFLAR